MTFPVIVDTQSTTKNVVLVDPATGQPYVASGGGGGGSSGGTATAVQPTYTEGATGQPLSLNLRGGLRVDIVKQSTGVAPAANTITAGGTDQQLFAANANRRGIVFQNRSTGPLYLGTTQDQASLLIPPSGYYETPINHSGTAEIRVIGPTTGQQFYAREYS